MGSTQLMLNIALGPLKVVLGQTLADIGNIGNRKNIISITTCNIQHDVDEKIQWIVDNYPLALITKIDIYVAIPRQVLHQWFAEFLDECSLTHFNLRFNY